ncbi:hypothetical protein [uncultured Friedmanniella sp.]|uniref:hypothetical protein n=1 Tax=uncultured Friedmanniella sp. TaxID=335381 RepID=UPI0035C9FE5C
MIDTDNVAAARALLSKATPGPWYVVRKDERADVRGLPENTTYDHRGDAVARDPHSEYGACSLEDAELIAQAPTLLAALADEVEQLRKELAESERARKGHHVNSCTLNGTYHGEGCPERVVVTS